MGIDDIIGKLNHEFSELQNEHLKLQSDHIILQKELELMKNKYEPNKELESLIICSIWSKSNNDIARVIYEIYKGKFKCTSINNNTWYYLNTENKWIKSDEGIEIVKVINECKKVYEQYLNKLNVVLNDPDNEEFYYNDHLLIAFKGFFIKYNQSDFSRSIFRECMEYFYTK